MFTDEDCRNYFKAISFIERDMLYGVSGLLSRIREPETAGILKTVVGDEARHYLLVVNNLESLFLKKYNDKRAYIREHWTGAGKAVILKDNSGLKIRCVNVSQGGACVESRKIMKPGDDIELTLNFYGRKDRLLRKGAVIWVEKIYRSWLMHGIEFRDKVDEI